MKLFTYLSSTGINQILSTSRPFSLTYRSRKKCEDFSKESISGNWFKNEHNLNIYEGDPNQAVYNRN